MSGNSQAHFGRRGRPREARSHISGEPLRCAPSRALPPGVNISNQRPNLIGHDALDKPLRRLNAWWKI